MQKFNNKTCSCNIITEICWEDFEAPEWCVPIKADVLTFEWDVSTKT